MGFELGPRRGQTLEVTTAPDGGPPAAGERGAFEELDLLYRSLCAILYNYVPMSGHPGGSISSGRIVAGLLFDAMDYDLSRPDRADADVVSYAAGHKAMGLYAMWALRDEVARLSAPELLRGLDARLRLEDLLGFRRNPITPTTLFRRVRVTRRPPRAHHHRLATAPRGGPWRRSGWPSRCATGSAATARASRPGGRGRADARAGGRGAGGGHGAAGERHRRGLEPGLDRSRRLPGRRDAGDYVQWDPRELFQLDWNDGRDGMDFAQVGRPARGGAMSTGQPTAVVCTVRAGNTVSRAGPRWRRPPCRPASTALAPTAGGKSCLRARDRAPLRPPQTATGVERTSGGAPAGRLRLEAGAADHRAGAPAAWWRGEAGADADPRYPPRVSVVHDIARQTGASARAVLAPTPPPARRAGPGAPLLNEASSGALIAPPTCCRPPASPPPGRGSGPASGTRPPTRAAACSPSAAFVKTPSPACSPGCRPSAPTSASDPPTARSSRPSATWPPACTASASRPGARPPASRTGRWCSSAPTPA